MTVADASATERPAIVLDPTALVALSKMKRDEPWPKPSGVSIRPVSPLNFEIVCETPERLKNAPSRRNVERNRERNRRVTTAS